MDAGQAYLRELGVVSRCEADSSGEQIPADFQQLYDDNPEALFDLLSQQKCDSQSESSDSDGNDWSRIALVFGLDDTVSGLPDSCTGTAPLPALTAPAHSAQILVQLDAQPDQDSHIVPTKSSGMRRSKSAAGSVVKRVSFEDVESLSSGTIDDSSLPKDESHCYKADFNSEISRAKSSLIKRETTACAPAHVNGKSSERSKVKLKKSKSLPPEKKIKSKKSNTMPQHELIMAYDETDSHVDFSNAFSFGDSNSYLADMCHSRHVMNTHVNGYHTYAGTSFKRSPVSRDTTCHSENRRKPSSPSSNKDPIKKMRDASCQTEDSQESLAVKPRGSDLRDKELDSPLLQASYQGDVNKLQELVAAQKSAERYDGSRLLDRDDQGNSALHIAVARGNLECVRYLCSEWPQLIEAENRSKLTPAGVAIQHSELEVLDWLLGQNECLKGLDTARRPLTHLAAKFGEDGCMRLILERMNDYGLPGNLIDCHGNSAAHIAAKQGHLNCLQSLVEYGVDVTQENNFGQNPCFYADFGNHRQCVAFLMIVQTCVDMAHSLLSQQHKQEGLPHTELHSGSTHKAWHMIGEKIREAKQELLVYRTRDRENLLRAWKNSPQDTPEKADEQALIDSSHCIDERTVESECNRDDVLRIEMNDSESKHSDNETTVPKISLDALDNPSGDEHHNAQPASLHNQNAPNEHHDVFKGQEDSTLDTVNHPDHDSIMVPGVTSFFDINTPLESGMMLECKDKAALVSNNTSAPESKHSCEVSFNGASDLSTSSSLQNSQEQDAREAFSMAYKTSANVSSFQELLPMVDSHDVSCDAASVSKKHEESREAGSLLTDNSAHVTEHPSVVANDFNTRSILFSQSATQGHLHHSLSDLYQHKQFQELPQQNQVHYASYPRAVSGERPTTVAVKEVFRHKLYTEGKEGSQISRPDQQSDLPESISSTNLHPENGMLLKETQFTSQVSTVMSYKPPAMQKRSSFHRSSFRRALDLNDSDSGCDAGPRPLQNSDLANRPRPTSNSQHRTRSPSRRGMGIRINGPKIPVKLKLSDIDFMEAYARPSQTEPLIYGFDEKSMVASRNLDKSASAHRKYLGQDGVVDDADLLRLSPHCSNPRSCKMSSSLPRQKNSPTRQVVSSSSSPHLVLASDRKI